MGTDIHGVFQKQAADGSWQDVETEFKFNRHYQLFAVLAGVRNGFGFAGVPTGDPVEPISKPRGLPEGFITNVAACEADYEPTHNGQWMGDHSHSWLSCAEMLEWWKHAPEVTKVGVLSRGTYENWDKVGPPEVWSGGVSGGGVVIASEDPPVYPKGWNYISCRWRVKLADELDYFFTEVRRLVDLHGKIRFVFGFDS